MTRRVELGQKVRDKISGFEGIAVARTQHLNGCDRITIGPKVDKDGKLGDCETFDEPDIEVLEPAPTKTETDSEPPGGPHGHKGLQLGR